MRYPQLARYLLSLTFSLVAWSSAFSSGLSTQQRMTLLQFKNDPIVLVSGASNWGNPDGCDSDSIAILSTEVGYHYQPLFFTMYDTLLAAHLAETEVRFRFRGCIQLNGKTYPSIVRIDIFSNATQ